MELKAKQAVNKTKINKINKNMVSGSLHQAWINSHYKQHKHIFFPSQLEIMALNFLPRTWLFMSNSAGVSRKAEDTYTTGAPGPFSQFLVESELLICFCYFVWMILVTVCFLLRMSVFNVRSLSLDYILLITAVTLVLSVTPSVENEDMVFTKIQI